jgi:hypothetical protein
MPLLPVVALGLFLFSPPVRADIDAVTTGAFDAVGYMNGAVAFSFTPTTNLAVTRVGYLNIGANNPIVSFWSDTNFPFASYQLVPGPTSGQMVYSNVTITLLAGRRYSISIQDGPLSSSVVVLQAYANGQFQPAPELAGYVGENISTAGVFNSFATNYFYLGPNFSYQIQAAPQPSPFLDISRSNADTAVITWPAPSSGFVLIQKPSLTVTNWALTTNAISVVNGTNEVIVSPLTGNQFYRLLHP